MPSVCSVCTNTITRNNDSKTIDCVTCKQMFHPKCVGISVDLLNVLKTSWNCNNCNKSPNIDIKSLLKKFEQFKLDLCEVKGSINKLEKSCDTVTEIGLVVSKQQTEIESLKKEVQILRAGVNRLETLNRSNNIVITGVPETINENLLMIAAKIGEIIGAPMTRDKISKFTRFRAKSSNIKPILIVLNNFYDKQSILARFRAVKVITGDKVGLDTTVKIRIGDHINSNLQKLLALARKKLVEKGIMKYVWIQNGDVLVRKDAISKIIKIKRSEDVDKLEAGH